MLNQMVFSSFLHGFKRAAASCGVLILASVSSQAGEKATSLDFGALLERHKLPGISVVVVDDYRLVYAEGFGVKEYGQAAKVDTHTAFSAASISKSVTGLVAAMLVEAGVLDLDVPVSRYLKRWRLPESAFTATVPITLRHLLSHTAGTSQSGFADYFPGDDIPTLVNSLKGEKLARSREPIEIMWQPGSRFKYSGGGYVIAQVAMEDVTGKPLATLAQEMIFTPLGMKDTTMVQNGHPAFLKNVAKAHEADLSLAGPGGVPIYPQTAASGMWTTPSDMAKLMIDVQKALAGKPSEAVSPWVARETTGIQTLHKAGGWGLGWMRYMADGNLDWFSHSGYNTGIGGLVMASMADGRAIAVFGNGVHRARIPAIDAVVADVIKTRGWGRDLPAPTQTVPIDLVKDLVGTYENLNAGFFSPFNTKVTIRAMDGKLMLDNSMGKHPARAMIYVGTGRFMLDRFVGSQIGLSRDGTGVYLTFYRDGLESRALRRLD